MSYKFSIWIKIVFYIYVSSFCLSKRTLNFKKTTTIESLSKPLAWIRQTVALPFNENIYLTSLSSSNKSWKRNNKVLTQRLKKQIQILNVFFFPDLFRESSIKPLDICFKWWIDLQISINNVNPLSENMHLSINWSNSG